MGERDAGAGGGAGSSGGPRARAGYRRPYTCAIRSTDQSVNQADIFSTVGNVVDPLFLAHSQLVASNLLLLLTEQNLYL
jgi:hypothetical protein